MREGGEKLLGPYMVFPALLHCICIKNDYPITNRHLVTALDSQPHRHPTKNIFSAANKPCVSSIQHQAINTRHTHPIIPSSPTTVSCDGFPVPFRIIAAARIKQSTARLISPAPRSARPSSFKQSAVSRCSGP